MPVGNPGTQRQFLAYLWGQPERGGTIVGQTQKPDPQGKFGDTVLFSSGMPRAGAVGRSLPYPSPFQDPDDTQRD